MRYLLLFIIVMAVSCKDIAYNRVNNDTQISNRNKAVLNAICSRNFPSPPPEYIKGKDSIITVYKTDTTYSVDSFTHDTTITVTKVITNDHLRVDTLRQPDKYVVAAMQDKNDALTKALNESYVKCGIAEAEKNAWRKRFIILASGVVLASIIFGLIKMYL